MAQSGCRGWGSEYKELERRPKAGLVPGLEANVGAMSGGKQLGRSSVTSRELDPFSPIRPLTSQVGRLRACAQASVMQWASEWLEQG